MVKEKVLMKLLDKMKQLNTQDEAVLSYCLRRKKIQKT